MAILIGTFDGCCTRTVVKDGQFTKCFARSHPAQYSVTLDDFQLPLGRHVQMRPCTANSNKWIRQIYRDKDEEKRLRFRKEDRDRSTRSFEPSSMIWLSVVFVNQFLTNFRSTWKFYFYLLFPFETAIGAGVKENKHRAKPPILG